MSEQEAAGSSLSQEDVLTAISEVPSWRHRITIGGVTTPGTEDSDAELARLNLPRTFSGLRVLDIGCSDGLYSFEAERRGATQVVAIDDESSLLAGGVNGFQLARRLLESNVQYQVRDVEHLNPADDGTYDFVLFINVLYHLRNPVRSLEAIHSVTKPGGTMILKSYFQTDLRKWFRGRCIGFDIDPRPKMWFYPDRELAGDPTNWFGPNRRGLEALLQSTGWSFTLTRRWGDRLYYRCVRQ